MIGFFSRKCPLETYEKTWTEWRMRWFADQFGIERMRCANVVLPTEEFFPEPYERSEAYARRLMHRLCDYMAIDSSRLSLEVCHNDELPGVAGHYDYRSNPDSPIIRIAESQLDDPESLVATLAHELAHEILLGGKILSPVVADHEWTTDLLPLFLGLGIPAANSTVKVQQYRGGGYRWSSIGRHGYLPARIFGYGFALFAFMRGEREPAWSRYLRRDALVPFREGIRFLRKSDDCLFHPQTLCAAHPRPTDRQLARPLESRSPTVRLSTLWEIRDRRPTDPSIIEAVTARLSDRDQAVAVAAADALSAIGPPAAPAVRQLIVGLSHKRETIRLNFVRALGALRCEPDVVVPEIEDRLSDDDRDVACEAARALGRFGGAASASVPRLLSKLQSSLARCDHPFSDALVDALAAITPEPKRCIQDYFGERDAELLNLALVAIDDRTQLRHG